MPESDLKDTQPNSPVSLKDTQPNPALATRQKNFPRWLVALVIVVLIVIGLVGGYGSGMGRRMSAENTQVAGQLQEQYQLGVQALDAGQYEIAKQHFDFIIQNDPSFPGVQSAYADLLLRMQITPSPTFTLTPTVSPTPDLRGAEVIYNDVTALLSADAPNLCARDWDGILGELDSLRQADSSYHTAEVDGMYYIALRNRGVCKIYPQAYETNTVCSQLNINLEGGIYDLTLAERFGPLDGQADSLRTFARLYITAASFWDQDWVQARNYFDQVRAAYPNLSDSSCVTATDRWRQASIEYAEQLLVGSDPCAAQDQYDLAFTVNSPQNEPYYPTGTAMAELCGPGPGGGEGSDSEESGTPTPTCDPASGTCATP